MGKKTDDTTPETPDSNEVPATDETPVAAADDGATPPPPETPEVDATASGGSSKGVVAAIAGGTAVLALIVGLLIGWIVFDGDGGRGGRGDKDRMSQKQQGPGMDRQKGGDQKGRMMPGPGGRESGPGGQMMPGQDGGGRQGRGQMTPDGATPTTPSAPSTQATPQGLQQG